MLAGTAYFYNGFKHVILEMDIEDFDGLSNEELFQKILEFNAVKVVLRGVSHNHQENENEQIIFERN